MAWNYTPKDASDCLDEGKYEAFLERVEQKTSSKGNPMLAVIWTVPWNGRDWRVRDFIVNPSTLFKLKLIAKAWNEQREFDEGRFDMEEHIKQPIMLHLDVQTSAIYGDQNQVVGYEASSGAPPPAKQPVAADADVPF